MRPPVIDKLAEHERIFLRDAWKEYPGALSFPPERAPDMDAVAAGLIDKGYIERVEHTEVDPEGRVSYRVTDDWAGRLKAVAERIGWD